MTDLCKESIHKDRESKYCCTEEMGAALDGSIIADSRSTTVYFSAPMISKSRSIVSLFVTHPLTHLHCPPSISSLPVWGDEFVDWLSNDGAG